MSNSTYCNGCKALNDLVDLSDDNNCESCQYEADAKADHVTEQIPNV